MDDATLMQEFEACTLPFELWNHRCHVKVGYLQLRRSSFAESLTRMRAGIKAINAANKVEESPTSGYNETTTHAFLHLIAAVMAAYGKAMPTACADEFCDAHPQLMSRHALRFFYSPARRMDPQAKKEFVPPDLAALPRI